MSRDEASNRETPLPPLDKQVVRLPDGRELTYYRFPDPPAAPPARPGKPQER